MRAVKSLEKDNAKKDAKSTQMISGKEANAIKKNKQACADEAVKEDKQCEDNMNKALKTSKTKESKDAVRKAGATCKDSVEKNLHKCQKNSGAN